MELRQVGRGGEDSDTVATIMAESLCPELSDEFDPELASPYTCVMYAMSEMTRNVCDHSGSFGFALSQHYPHNGMTKLAIADCGIGLLGSFRGCGLWKEHWSDKDAIEAAMTPFVTSKGFSVCGEPANAGVGLTILRELAKKLNGSFTLASGTGYYSLTGHANIANGCGFKGTICSIAYSRKSMSNWADTLASAQEAAGI